MSVRSRLEEITREALAAAEKAGPTRAHAVFAPKKVAAMGAVPGDLTPGANKMERHYGERLEALKRGGEILDWWWQPGSFRLTFLEDGRGDFYRPDFMVQTLAGELQIHETKGFMQDDARTKLKVFAVLHPYRVFLVEWKAKAWKLTEYRGSFP